MTDPLIAAAQRLAADMVAEARRVLALAEASGAGNSPDAQALRESIADVERHAANPPRDDT